MLTHQEIFERVARHLAAQGRKSMEQSTCLYRGPEGTRCAIGIFIPDEAYSAGIEHRNAEALLGRSPEAVPELAEFLDGGGDRAERISFLGDMQQCHDRAIASEDKRFTLPWELAEWEILYDRGVALRLSETAARHGLDGAIVEQLWPREEGA